MIITTNMKCPACQEPLLATAGTPWLLWCPSGPCPSTEANNGAYGETIGEAFDVLADKIDAELRGKEVSAN